MILKGSQRGGARQLAHHLLNAKENDHVEIHEIYGFSGETVIEALDEARAISKGTKCRQFLYSLSLSPPEDKPVPLSAFEHAVDKVEERLNLSGQPRVIIFHEKNARRHAHVVWSRIKINDMKAINMAHDRRKLNEVSKSLYFQHGWDIPKGFLDKSLRDPLNFSLEEWQQSKRLKINPKEMKAILKACWNQSDDNRSFTSALESHGMSLAKGDKRGYVAVHWQGEVLSLSRWTGTKTKELKARIGDSEKLPSVEDTKRRKVLSISTWMKTLVDEVDRNYEPRRQKLQKEKAQQKAQHQKQRLELRKRQKERNRRDTIRRQDRLRTGLRGVWDRVTGQHRKVRLQNERETYDCSMRDKKETDSQIFRQLKQRQTLQTEIEHYRQKRDEEINLLKTQIASNFSANKNPNIRRQFDSHAQKLNQPHDREM